MTESIEDLLQRIDDYKKEFYPRAIELHENKRLRKLVKIYIPAGMELIKCLQGEIGLNYDFLGFCLKTSKYKCSDYSDCGYYDEKSENFVIKEGILVAKNKELLEYFPKLKLDVVEKSIEGKLKEQIKNLDIYKMTMEKK